MKKYLAILLMTAVILMTVSPAWAVSEGGVLFLMISPGARAAGMGEAFVAMSDDATASFWNPAGLAYTKGNEVTIMHANWLPQLVSDMYYDFVGGRMYMESLGGSLGGNITFLNLGENVWTSEGGDELGRFNSYEMAVTLSYGTLVGKNTGLGVSMRFIRSMLAPDWVKVGAQKGNGTGTAFAVDLGVLQRIPYIKGLTFGANLSNMGPKITYINKSQADPLPTNLKMGFSYKLIDDEFNKLLFTIDTNKQLIRKLWQGASGTDVEGKKISHEKYIELQDEDIEKYGEDDKTNWESQKYESISDPFYKAIFTSWGDGSFREQLKEMDSSVGVEYIYNNMIAMRAGYYYDEDGQVKYPSFGAGLRYNMFQFDFAYIAAEEGHPLSDTMRFSLTAAF
ncbi:PorV/PorQ family protein [bacterium]|nr:PorV/PorQ family protein [bacterium]